MGWGREFFDDFVPTSSLLLHSFSNRQDKVNQRSEMSKLEQLYELIIHSY